MKKIAVLVAASMTLTACSMFDKSDDYQLSRSNSTQLIVPEGAMVAKDSLVIPNEDGISNINEKQAFESPEIPESYQALADLDVTWDGDLMWIQTPLIKAEAKAVIKNFLVSLYGEGNPIDADNGDEIISAPVGDREQSGLLKFYYSVTRLYPDRSVYRFVIEEKELGARIGFQYKTVSEDQSNNVTSSKWIRPDTSQKDYVIALQLLSALSRESLDESQLAETTTAKDIWLTSDGQYVLRLGAQAQTSDVIELIEQSDLFLLSRDPLELAFVTEDQVAKVGELRSIYWPGFAGGEDLFLFKMKRRSLDSVDWNKRAYPVELVQRREGAFVEVDVSATDYPDVVSYRIMSALKN